MSPSILKAHLAPWQRLKPAGGHLGDFAPHYQALNSSSAVVTVGRFLQSQARRHQVSIPTEVRYLRIFSARMRPDVVPDVLQMEVENV